MRIHIVLQNVIIAIGSIIPFSCSQPKKANLSEVETVYVTSQHWPKTFHATTECRGLDNYNGVLYLSDLDDLFITEYQPCGYCFNITKIPSLSSKEHKWIRQSDSARGERVYFWDDIRYSDGFFFLNVCFIDSTDDETIKCYIYNHSLTEYREETRGITVDYLNREPPLYPIYEETFPDLGVEFIRYNLSWKKAIMNVVPE